MQHEEVIKVLNEPLAQELLQSSIPVRFAYTGTDGAPRVVPLGFHWNGAEVVVCTVPRAPKVRALEADPRVALTIDTNAFPPNLLLVRGKARIEVVDGVPSEFLEGARKQVQPEGWESFESGVRALYMQMARITVVPEWAKLIDFETSLPSAVAQLVEEAGQGPTA